MSDDMKIVEFPKAEVPPEEIIRRQRVVAERLAGGAPGEWRLWVGMRAAELGIETTVLAAAVKEIIAQKEKAERERKADEERARRDAEKTAERKRRERAKSTEREFKLLTELPEREQDARLDSLARRLGEDPAAVREEFALATSSPAPESVELWPDAVETAALLEELIAQLKRFVVFKYDIDPPAAALWIAFAWIHDIAAIHSPILAVMAPDINCGKTTMLGALKYLTPRSFAGAELTGPWLFRRVDRDRPTLIIDEAGDLFHRKRDLQNIVNTSWIRGTMIPRVVQGVDRDFDPFCPKVIAFNGTALPHALASRCIVITLWRKLPSEKAELFPYADVPEFRELRRKLMRWSVNHAAALAEANPASPPDFDNRLAANWRLLFAIADHAGGAWPEQARKAALSRAPLELSEGGALLEALRRLRAQGGNKESIASAAIVQALAADKDGEWCEYKGRGPITQRQVAALLKNYGIFPRTIHPTGKADASPRGYFWADFDDAFARFLPADPHIRTQASRKKRK
jgi:putative DNA primase/helicase